jgi:hypothetical protein
MIRTMLRTAMLAASAVLAAGTNVSAGDKAPIKADQRVEIGFAIAAQQGISLDPGVPAQGLGSYLTNSMGCSDCHTWPNYAPGGNPFNRQPAQVPLANYLAGGRLFALPTEDICSRNLTPAVHTKLPAGLSRVDFLYVLRTGCDPQDANFRDPARCELLQVMPWPNYQNVDKQEVSAIYTYLSALPHAEPGLAAQCQPDPQGIAHK